MHLAISDRLSLRPFRRSDAEDLFRYISDWQVAQWLARLPYPYSMADAKSWVADNATPATIPPFKLCLARDDRLIGGIGLVSSDEPDRLELGYWLSRPTWGQGIMTHVVGSLLAATDHAVPDLKLCAGVEPSNLRSAAVLERLGFAETGTRTIWSVPRQSQVTLRWFIRDRNCRPYCHAFFLRGGL